MEQMNFRIIPPNFVTTNVQLERTILLEGCPHKADIEASRVDVRFRGKADMASSPENVRF